MALTHTHKYTHAHTLSHTHTHIHTHTRACIRNPHTLTFDVRDAKGGCDTNRGTTTSVQEFFDFHKPTGPVTTCSNCVAKTCTLQVMMMVDVTVRDTSRGV
jgi:hypothetical protein